METLAVGTWRLSRSRGLVAALALLSGTYLVMCRGVTTFEGLLGFTALVALGLFTLASSIRGQSNRPVVPRPFRYSVVMVGLVIGFLARDVLLGVGLYQVASHSMQPGLKPGQFLLVDQWASSPARCARIVFHHQGEIQVKRVAAIAGDTLTLQGNRLRINHSPPPCLPASEEIAVLRLPEPEVPSDHFFVLGDNARYSRDSRAYGSVPASTLLGPVTDVW